MHKITLEAYGRNREDIEMALNVAQTNALFIVEKGVLNIQVEKIFMKGTVQGTSFMLEVEKVNE